MYAQSAQDRSEELLDKEQYLRKRDLHIEECRAQLGMRRASRRANRASHHGSSSSGSSRYQGRHRHRTQQQEQQQNDLIYQVEGDSMMTTPGGLGGADGAGGAGAGAGGERMASASASGGNPHTRVLRQAIVPTVEGQEQAMEVEMGGDSEAAEEEEEMGSLLELEWVEGLNLSMGQRMFVQYYVDPAVQLVRRERKPIVVISLLTVCAYQVVNWLLDDGGDVSKRREGGGAPVVA